jgi:type IV fimbrial biogenesis protein FimT
MIHLPEKIHGAFSANAPGRSATAGFSLIELVIVIAIMGIVMTIATLNFNSWQVKNRVEGQTREILADLNEARTNSFTQKKQYGIVFQPNSYVINSYSSASAAASPLTAGSMITSKTLKYGLTKAGASIVDTPVVFETSGITFDWFTIFVNQGTTNQTAAVNCIVISTARVNMGKINGTACEFK